jgi:hypothetical protein
MKKVILCLIISIFLFNLVSSTQTITNVNIQSGYTIYYPEFEYVKQDASFTLHVYASNRSTSLILPNTDVGCYLRLFNSSGLSTYDSGVMNKTLGNRHTLYIAPNNFSELGQHSYFIWCNSTAFGGEASGLFEVTPTGKMLNSSQTAILLSGLILLVILFIINIGVIPMLPSGDNRDEEGTLISINQLKYLRGILYLTAYFLLIGIVFVGANITLAYSGETFIGGVLFTMFRLLFGFALPIIVLWFIYLFYSIFQDKQMKGYLERGLDLR